MVTNNKKRQNTANPANADFAEIDSGKEQQSAANPAVNVNANANVNANVSSNEDIYRGADKPPVSSSPGRKKFVPPTLDEVAAYCNERRNSVSPSAFIDFYTANGWVQGRGKPIRDWKAAVRTWERRDRAGNQDGKRTRSSAEAYHAIFEEMGLT